MLLKVFHIVLLLINKKNKKKTTQLNNRADTDSSHADCWATVRTSEVIYILNISYTNSCRFSTLLPSVLGLNVMKCVFKRIKKKIQQKHRGNEFTTIRHLGPVFNLINILLTSAKNHRVSSCLSIKYQQKAPRRLCCIQPTGRNTYTYLNS